MKAVVDTNVIAYFLLGTPKFVAEAREFWNQADELLAPAIWEAEITNVIWMATRARVVPRRTPLQSWRSLAGLAFFRSTTERFGTVR